MRGPFDGAAIAAVLGVDGAPVRLVGYRNVVAAVSTAVPADLDEEALSARLERLEELELIARAHHAVVDAVGAHAVTLPFRLATIHLGDAGVVDMLRRNYTGLDSKLERLSGKVELGVKVYIDAESGESASAGPDVEPVDAAEAATTGRGYLLLRKQQQRSREDAWQRTAEAASFADTELTNLATVARHHRPQQRPLRPDRGDNVLNAAYLIDAALVETFTARVQDLDSELFGTRVEVTGPWAPYSFVDDADQ